MHADLIASLIALSRHKNLCANTCVCKCICCGNRTRGAMWISISIVHYTPLVPFCPPIIRPIGTCLRLHQRATCKHEAWLQPLHAAVKHFSAHELEMITSGLRTIDVGVAQQKTKYFGYSQGVTGPSSGSVNSCLHSPRLIIMLFTEQKQVGCLCVIHGICPLYLQEEKSHLLLVVRAYPVKIWGNGSI